MSTQPFLPAILLDLGDVIMREATEEKIDDVTQRADLVPGIAALLHELRQQGVPLGLVADTRIGTYRNVLSQHDLYELFDTFAISEQLGVEKPDARMFLHALEALEIPPADWARVPMVGNNLRRDIRGARALGLTTIWFAWNNRYPLEPRDKAEHPDYQVGSAAELGTLLTALRQGLKPTTFPYPRPFPW